MRKNYFVKIIIIIIIVAALTLGLSTYSLTLLVKTSDKLIQNIKSTDSLIEKSTWKEADNSFNEILKDWKSTKRTWAILIDHQEIDKIDDSIVKLGENIKLQQMNEALVESATLKRLVKHIPLKDMLTIGNIF